MKRGTILFISLILLTNIISAYSYGGNSSVADMLEQFDSRTVSLAIVFFVSLILINAALKRTKVLGEEPKNAGIVSALLAFGITYYLNRQGLDIDNWFYSGFEMFGFSGDLIYQILPFILIAAIAFMFVKLGTKKTFIYTGAFFCAASFVIYEGGAALLIGIILLVIGLAFLKDDKKNKKPRFYFDDD